MGRARTLSGIQVDLAPVMSPLIGGVPVLLATIANRRSSGE